MAATHHENTDAIEMLVQKGAEIDAQENSGKTALMRAAYFQNEKGVKKLLELGTNLEIVDNEGYTAIFYAVQSGKLQIVETMIAYGARLDRRDNGGFTILDIVPRPDILESIIKHWANPVHKDFRNGYGYALGAKNGATADLFVQYLKIMYCTCM